MMSTFASRVTVIVQSMLVILAVHTARACAEDPNGNALGMLPLSRDPVTGPVPSSARRLPTSVKWLGQEYDVDSGIDVLMSIIRDADKSAEEHESALIELAVLGRQLQSHPCLDELDTLYDRGRCLEKSIILTCFLGSRDPRGIPVFIRTLDKEEYMKLRLSAASGLARWNVRRGVAQLVDLLDSREIIRSRMPYVRDNALESFRNANSRKGWGFPDEEVRKSIESQVVGFDREEFEKRWESGDEETRKSIETRARLAREQFLALYNAEVRKWFAENERRFPDWKLGDPLPADAEGDKNDSSKP